MVRREIRNFELVTEAQRYECSVPFSVKSVLSAAGVELDSITEKVSFESKIYVDDVALAMKNFYIRIKGINMPAKVYLEGRMICRVDGVTPVYNIDLSGQLSHGDNILSIRFDAIDGDIIYAGLCEAVEILRFSGAIVDRVHLSESHSEGCVDLGIDLDLIGDENSVRAVATLVSSAGQIYYAGLTKGHGVISVKDPLYWWPKGQGVQNLYRLTVNLYGEADIEDTAEIRLGLRKAEATDDGSFTINGARFMPMGAVHIPECDPDLTHSDVRTEGVVTAAAMSGYNCIVIPLGAPTPSEKFYDLCDVHGITVIEEHDSIDEALVLALHNRSHHPSLCLIDLIGGGDRSEEIKLLRNALPEMQVRVAEEQPEYLAIPSLPSMKTIRAAIPEEERNLFSYSIESIAEPGAIREMLLSVAERYPYPKDLSDFAYASALAAAHKVGDMIKDSRLSHGTSGRGVFYRLSDSEMTISPSAIDSRGRWKPLQYYSRRHFEPVSVYCDIKDGVVSFSVSNQRRGACIGSLEYRIADASNYTVFTDSVPCEIGAAEVAEIHNANISEYIKGHEREYYLEYYIKEGSFRISSKTMLFVPEKHFCFKKPKIKAVVTGQDRRFSLTISSDAFVKDMEIGFDGVDVVFDDNYFDMTSEAPIKINFTVTGGMETTYHLKDVLEMRSVVDLNK